MQRRTFLKKLSKTALLSMMAPGFSNCYKTRMRPNVILILLDDFGWKDCGFMGSKYYETPNIDKLADDGMIFTNAYANAPNCAPSRASLLTGQYPPRHGIFTVNSAERGASKDRKIIPVKNKRTLEPEKLTLAEELKNAGYATAAMGKWHMGEGKNTGPLGQGFDLNVGGIHKGHPPAGYFAPYQLPNLSTDDPNEYLTDRLNQEALNFIEKNKNHPFFLYLSHYAVHTPIQGKQAILKKYENKPGSKGQNNPEYAAMIESCDIGVGKILDKLKELDLDDETIVIFFSDNGGVAGITSQAPLRGGKGMLYEGGIRVPLAIRWPGKIAAHSVASDNVIGLDLYPTILDLAKIKSDSRKKTDGVSLKPLLMNQNSLNRKDIFFHFPAYLQGHFDMSGARDNLFRTRPGGVIISGDWKLIEYFEDNDFELYNLKRDISEQNNLAEQYSEKVEELYEKMIAWRASVKAPVPKRLNPDYQGERKN